ncbi:MAG: AAA domain-containing protein [Bacteroidaceae bacterium]|nr:AAA domain-containing protein [Bacteroidaceae bacterium]
MIQALEEQRQLLQREFAHEKAEYQRQMEATSIPRKVRRGICWFPLRVGRSYYNSLDQLVVEVSRTDFLDEEHNFEPGKPVCFFSEDGAGMLNYLGQRAGKGTCWPCTVSYVEDDRMVVTLPSQEALLQVQNAERLGIQMALDETTYKLMFEALDRVIEAKGNRLAELRDICHTSAPTQKYTFLPQRFPWLNPSQEQAVNEVLWAKDVAVVHGPPGTGKTTTLVEAIYETLHRETQVLVCAQSNMAVDWIAEKLCDRGVNVLRIGNPTRVTDNMLAQTYERRFEGHPQYSQLWAIRKAIRELYASRKHGNTESFQQKVNRLKERATELEFNIQEQLFNEARVIACTLTGSAHRLLMGRRFGTLFIDEAAQALEAACWIAIPKADRFILAGDHRQLPPTLKTVGITLPHHASRQMTDADNGGKVGVGPVTLMEHLVNNKPKCVSLLRVQYRMCDAIMQFPNQEFYEGMLESDPSVKYRGILDWDSAIEWVTANEQCEQVEQKTERDLLPECPKWTEAVDGLSRVNPFEAELTVRVLQQYFEKIGRDRILHERIDVGLISPYRGQVRLLRQLIKQNKFFKPVRNLISVNTVDGFQGQERDVIVISMVRSNEDGQVGFLRDLRRMNVAITRARMKLIIIGDADTLCKHPFYRKLKKYIESLDEY